MQLIIKVAHDYFKEILNEKFYSDFYAGIWFPDK